MMLCVQHLSIQCPTDSCYVPLLGISVHTYVDLSVGVGLV